MVKLVSELGLVLSSEVTLREKQDIYTQPPSYGVQKIGGYHFLNLCFCVFNSQINVFPFLCFSLEPENSACSWKKKKKGKKKTLPGSCCIMSTKALQS